MMAEKLVATIEQRRSGARLIKLAGVLDEENGLGELVEKVQPGMALINLSGVERINSHGTRDWVNWIASLEAKGIRPILIACSPAVVAQLNRIKNFVGNAVVKSFQVPYRCTTCDRDKLLLVHIVDLQAPYTAPECLCDSCSAPMEVSDETGNYFAFVATLPPPPKDVPRDSDPVIETHSAENLARGSRASVTDVKAVSQPRLSKRGSRPSLSTFQVQKERPSEREILMPRAQPVNERPYLIAIVALLFCTLGILFYLLLS